MNLICMRVRINLRGLRELRLGLDGVDVLLRDDYCSEFGD